MQSQAWGKSIEISFGSGVLARHSVENTYDAARLLLDRWPETRGMAFRRAVRDCTLALRGELPHDLIPARLADAAREAGLDCIILDDTDALFEAELAQICIDGLCEDMVLH